RVGVLKDHLHKLRIVQVISCRKICRQRNIVEIRLATGPWMQANQGFAEC
ncbi:uncharacterized protein METZ01_LOCUS287371, partial [marine metagenome]